MIGTLIFLVSLPHVVDRRSSFLVQLLISYFACLNILLFVIFLMSGYHLLNQYGCCHKYKIPPSLLETLLGHLEVGYHRNGNPYHNNLHATDVLQTTHWLISQTGVKDRLSDLEIFALLFSAIIHDYQHTGTTNNFHIQSNSSLAIMYNDRSVLENHHVAAFFRWKNTDFENLGFLTGRCWTMSATSC